MNHIFRFVWHLSGDDLKSWNNHTMENDPVFVIQVLPDLRLQESVCQFNDIIRKWQRNASIIFNVKVRPVLDGEKITVTLLEALDTSSEWVSHWISKEPVGFCQTINGDMPDLFTGMLVTKKPSHLKSKQCRVQFQVRGWGHVFLTCTWISKESSGSSFKMRSVVKNRLSVLFQEFL